MRNSILAVFAACSLAACSDSPLTGPRSAALGTPAFDAAGGDASPGAVFTQTNATAGNAVVAFSRARDGSLTFAGTFSTGGNGIGGTTDPLASQYSLILDGEDANLLFVANAGSNNVSSFRVDGASLALVGTTGSRGTLPVSLAVARHTLYVLNAGSNAIAGFDVGEDGSLTPNAGASAALGAGAAGGAAVRASHDGQFLVVTEKGSRSIDVYQIGAHGALGQPVRSTSSGVSPFGFDFVNGDQIAVSEAGSAAASLYDVTSSGALSIEAASVSTNGQAAPCWLIATTNGRFAFTANAGSGTISGYGINAQGALQLLVPSGVSGSTGAGSTPLDLDLSRGDHFLYVLESGAGRIGAFAVSGNGALTALAGIGGLQAQHGYQGLAAY
jgi:6-phosphogluconolactonase (cycloisomerase 2 family)